MSAGSALSDLVKDYTDKPCNTFCREYFTQDKSCIHDFKFCTVCKELWRKSIYPTCPRHLNVSPNFVRENHHLGPLYRQHFLDKTIMRALTATQPYAIHDVNCDELCDYTFDCLEYCLCRHNMSKCPCCKRVWTARVECNCLSDYASTSDSSSNDSSDMETDSCDEDATNDGAPGSKVFVMSKFQ